MAYLAAHQGALEEAVERQADRVLARYDRELDEGWERSRREEWTDSELIAYWESLSPDVEERAA